MWKMQRRIWHKSPNIVFPIFIGIFYYWSLAGAWFFVFDQTTKLGEKIGIHYHYLLEKMFMVQLDIDYLMSIWIIGGFIIILQTVLLLLIPKHSNGDENSQNAKTKNENFYSFIALLFLAISILIVYDVIAYSLILNESVYLNIRSPHVPYYSLHQLACWIMMVCLTIPLAMGLRNKIKNNQHFSLSIFYWVVFGLGQFYLIFIGSRHEAFLCGLTIILFISYPHQKIVSQWRTYGCVLAIWMVILFLNDPFRSLSPVVGRSLGITTVMSSAQNVNDAATFREERTFIGHHNAQLSHTIIERKNARDTTFVIQQDTITLRIKDFEAQRKIDQEFIVLKGKKYKIPNPHISKAYQQSGLAEKLFRAITGIVFSNELFAGHFSMYGVIHYNVPIKLGISFKNLVYSFIPSFIQKERPQDVYGYYAEQLKLPKDQGFTINHITAWYINFGLIGILLGPIFIGLILMSPLLIGSKIWKHFPGNTAIFIFSLITCFGAMLIRSGPEGVKSILYEGIIIPLGLIWGYTLIQQIQNRLRS
jgi:hypothetical protein